MACMVCNGTVFVPKVVFRLSRPLGVIGYLVLVLTALGVAVLALAALGSATSSPGEKEMKQLLARSGLPADVQAALVKGESVPAWDLKQLTQEQRATIDRVEHVREHAATTSAIDAGMFGSALVLGLYAGFPALLLGLILTLKTKLLICKGCTASVPALWP